MDKAANSNALRGAIWAGVTGRRKTEREAFEQKRTLLSPRL